MLSIAKNRNSLFDAIDGIPYVQRGIRKLPEICLGNSEDLRISLIVMRNRDRANDKHNRD